MSIIKPSTAWPSGQTWISATARSYLKDQTPFAVDTVQDVRDNDFEQTRFLYVKAKGAFYRLNLSSTAADDGDTVLRDNIGRRYEKQGGGIREKLTANRTYYVRTDGSDGNNGLANTSGGAFLTIQAAINAAALLDFAGFKVTISVGAGTFSGRVIIPLIVGQADVSKLEITGAGVTSIISSTSAFTNSTVYCGVAGAGVTLSNLKIQNLASTTGCAVNAENSGQITIGAGVEIGGTLGWIWARASANGILKFTAGATISGDAGTLFGVQFGGYMEVAGVFALGTRALTVTAGASSTGVIFANTATFAGTVTGTRYDVASNAVIWAGGGSPTYFPGTIAGVTSTGGQYV